MKNLTPQESKPAPESQRFQWNPVATSNDPDMSKGQYSLSLARDAYQAGAMPLELIIE